MERLLAILIIFFMVIGAIGILFALATNPELYLQIEAAYLQIESTLASIF